MKAYYKGIFYYPKRKKANNSVAKTAYTPKKIVGKVGYCDNKTLGLKDKKGKYLKGGHYVYIRTAKNGQCDVNIITSLEDKKGVFQKDKIEKVRKGYLYPIPKDDATFSCWSALNLDGNIKNVPISKIKDIGKKSFKYRHRYYVGKFTTK